MHAVADAASSGPALTSVARHDAKSAAANMLNGNRERPNYLGVPSGAFTTSPSASVRMIEQQGRENGMKFRMKSEQASSWYTTRRRTCSRCWSMNRPTAFRRAFDRTPLRRSDRHLRARDLQGLDRRELEDDDICVRGYDFRHQLRAVGVVIKGTVAVSLPRPSMETTMQSMMDGMAGSGMMWGMGLFWVLILVVLVLGAAALIRHLFFGDKRK